MPEKRSTTDRGWDDGQYLLDGIKEGALDPKYLITNSCGLTLAMDQRHRIANKESFVDLLATSVGENVNVSKSVLRRLPKTDLHLHLDGSLRLETLIDLAREYEVDLPAYTPKA